MIYKDLSNETISSRIHESLDIDVRNINQKEAKLTDLINTYNSYFTAAEMKHQKLIDFINHATMEIIKPNLWVLNKVIDAHEAFIDLSCKVAMAFYPLARYTSIPYNALWIHFYKRMSEKYDNMLLIPGVHFIVALQGGGKSSILFDTIEEIRDIWGKFAYINVELEHPYYDEIAESYKTHHYLFEVEDYFGLMWDDIREKYIAQQMKQFDEHATAIVFDEWLANSNHRNNKTNDYNQKVIPIITALAKMRHQNISHVYFASQIDTTDNQVMSLFKLIHEVEIVRDIPYWKWVRDGEFKKDILGWNVWTYAFTRSKKGIEKVLIKKWFKPRYTEDFSRFNSLNQAGTFAHLPKDRLNIRKEI